MSEKTTGEDMLFEHDPKGAFAQFVAPMAGYGVTMASFFRPTVTEQYPREPARVMPRFHGRHQLNRYDDGLEKCVGCELCVNVCKFEAIALNEYGVAEVDEDKCIACGKCIQSGCPSVVLSDEKHPKTGKRKARIEPVTCVGCGICAQICPVHAISGPEQA